MRASFILITLLPALAAAHSEFKRQSDVPTCALPCIASVQGNCQTGDVACYCSDPTTIQSIQTCLQENCQGDDLQSASDAAGALCADNGVTTSFDPQTSATPTDNAESASSTSEVTDGSDISASLSGVTSAIEASASSAVGAIKSSTSAAAASVSSVRGAISSSLAGASSSHAAASSSAAAASASSSGAAMPTGRVGKGVVAGALMVAGGFVAGL